MVVRGYEMVRYAGDVNGSVGAMGVLFVVLGAVIRWVSRERRGDGRSGGVALLNHRLQAGTPGGVRLRWADWMDRTDLIGLRRRCECWLGEVLVGRGCRACRSIRASTAS